MNREELSEAILELCMSPHLRFYALEHAFEKLDIEQLGQLFDQVADHHAMLHPGGRRRVPRNPRLGDQTIWHSSRAAAVADSRARLCAHADDDGRGAHWLGPDEVCPYGHSQG